MCIEMASLTIRKLDDAAYDRLSLRAKRKNRSLEAEVRTMLEARERPIADVIADLSALSKRTAELGPMESSLALIRALRDEA